MTFILKNYRPNQLGFGRVFDLDTLNTMYITKAFALGQGTNLATLGA